MSDSDSHATGSPYAPQTAAETAAMLDAVGADDLESLFDVPESVAFDGEFGIDARSERAARREVAGLLGRNADLTEFLAAATTTTTSRASLTTSPAARSS